MIRRHIVLTLGHFKTASSTAVLQAAVSDSDSTVRIAACEAWGRRGGPEAAERLTGLLTSDTNLDVRLAAARAIGQTHEKSALQPLAEALSDGDPAIQYLRGRRFETDQRQGLRQRREPLAGLCPGRKPHSAGRTFDCPAHEKAVLNAHLRDQQTQPNRIARRIATRRLQPRQSTPLRACQGYPFRHRLRQWQNVGHSWSIVPGPRPI